MSQIFNSILSYQDKNKRRKATDDIFYDLRQTPSLTKKDLKAKYGEYYTDDIDDYVKSLKNVADAEKG